MNTTEKRQKPAADLELTYVPQVDSSAEARLIVLADMADLAGQRAT